MTNRQPVETLLIDPNPEDVRLFLEALESDRVANHIHTVSTGAEALDFLHQRDEYSNTTPPELIILDIELSTMDGHELLKELNGNPKLSDIPVIILTESDDAESITQSYQHYANAYVKKPIDPDEFINTVRSLEDFWFEVVWLPSEDDEKDEQFDGMD